MVLENDTSQDLTPLFGQASPERNIRRVMSGLMARYWNCCLYSCAILKLINQSASPVDTSEDLHVYLEEIRVECESR